VVQVIADRFHSDSNQYFHQLLFRITGQQKILDGRVADKTTLGNNFSHKVTRESIFGSPIFAPLQMADTAALGTFMT
jgi:hypothetical protein